MLTLGLQAIIKLSAKKCPTSKMWKEEMSKVPHQCVVASLMYVMMLLGLLLPM